MAILTNFHTCGLEEWISGSEKYLTTVKCKSAAGEVNDKQLAELYDIVFKINTTQKAINRARHKLILKNAKVLKIRKDVFLKILGAKANQVLQSYAQNKYRFLRDRIKQMSRIDSKKMSTSVEPPPDQLVEKQNVHLKNQKNAFVDPPSAISNFKLVPDNNFKVVESQETKKERIMKQ